MNDSIDNTQYSPNIYIKTRAATILAFIKVIEIILACYGLYLVVGTDLKISDSFNSFSNSLSNMSGYSAILASESILFSVITWVSIVGLSLIILDSVCVVLLRFTGRFSGIIRLIHTLIFIAMIIAFAMAIVGLVDMIRSIGQSGPDIAAFSRAYTLTYSGLALAGIGLTFGYHWNIASLMKTIGIERRTGQKRAAKKSSLPRICSYYSWVIAIPLILLAASWALITFGNLPANSWIRQMLQFVNYLETTDTISFVCEIGIGIFFIIKFSLVRACAKGFNAEHL